MKSHLQCIRDRYLQWRTTLNQIKLQNRKNKKQGQTQTRQMNPLQFQPPSSPVGVSSISTTKTVRKRKKPNNNKATLLTKSIQIQKENKNVVPSVTLGKLYDLWWNQTVSITEQMINE